MTPGESHWTPPENCLTCGKLTTYSVYCNPTRKAKGLCSACWERIEPHAAHNRLRAEHASERPPPPPDCAKRWKVLQARAERARKRRAIEKLIARLPLVQTEEEPDGD